MTEERKYAILFAATLLCARKLMELGDRPSPAKLALVENAISKQSSFGIGSTRSGRSSDYAPRDCALWPLRGCILSQHRPYPFRLSHG